MPSRTCDVGGNEGGQGEGSLEGRGEEEEPPGKGLLLAWDPPRRERDPLPGTNDSGPQRPRPSRSPFPARATRVQGGHARPSLGQLGARLNKWCYLFN